MRFAFLLLFAFPLFAAAQYTPQAGVAGSTAVSQTSSLIQGWATGCSVARGYRDIARPDSGFTSAGSANDATGAADGTLVSLGDSGVATLTFAQPITNGAGADFAVFENGFLNPQNAEEAFLELAFVEVSSDGVNYVRYPARSLTQTAVQLSSTAGLGYINARNIHNLAGKYRAGYGTPFDLSELAGKPGLNINAVTHVRVIDVVGHTGAYGSFDDSGSVINDPYPTFFATGGFDLDAVAVLNSSLSVHSHDKVVRVTVYPNPSDGAFWVETREKGVQQITVVDAVGKIVLQRTFSEPQIRLELPSMASGLYRILGQSQNMAPWSANVHVR